MKPGHKQHANWRASLQPGWT